MGGAQVRISPCRAHSHFRGRVSPRQTAPLPLAMAGRSPLRAVLPAALVGVFGAVLQGCGSDTVKKEFDCGGGCRVTQTCCHDVVTLSSAGCKVPLSGEGAKKADACKQLDALSGKAFDLAEGVVCALANGEKPTIPPIPTPAPFPWP